MVEIEKTIEILRKELGKKRKTTLNREAKKFTSYQTLVSCLLSLRSKDETTERVSKQLFKTAKTPWEMVKLDNSELEKLIFSSGHYRKKAKTIIDVSEYLIKNHEGKVPDSEEELLKMKGVGRKTANIVLCFSFNRLVLPIDIHCHRIPNRLGWIKTKNPDESEQALMKILPKKYWLEFNGLFVLFGKTICVPVSPFCSKCLVSEGCKRVGVERSR